MKKKLLLAIPAFLILLLFLVFFKGGDSLTLFQKIQTDQFLASNPFVDEESGEIIHTVHVAAANNSENTAQDSFLEFRNRYDSAASYVELNISFGKDGVAYLADSFDSVTESSVSFDRVLAFVAQQGDKDTGFVIDLCEYSSLGTLAASINKSGLSNRTVISGVNENSLETVKSYFSKVTVICDYDSETDSTLEELADTGADGILCTSDKFSSTLLKRAKNLGLQVWVKDNGEVYGILKALYYGVDGIVSTQPDMVTFAIDSWGENLVDDLKYNFDLNRI